MDAFQAKILNAFTDLNNNGLQTLSYWQDYFNHPQGPTLGLFNCVMSVGALTGLFILPFLLEVMPGVWFNVYASWRCFAVWLHQLFHACGRSVYTGLWRHYCHLYSSTTHHRDCTCSGPSNFGHNCRCDLPFRCIHCALDDIWNPEDPGDYPMW